MPANVSPFRIGLRAALGVLVVVALAALLWQLRHLAMLTFLATLLAAALVTPAAWLERHRWPRLAATLSLYGALVVLLGVVIFLVVPPLVEEAVAFAENLPELLEQGEQIATDVLGALLGAGAVERAFEIIGGADLMPEPGAVLQAPLLVAEILVNTVIVLVLSIFLLLERDRIREWMLRFFEPERREPIRQLSANAATKLGAYVRGQLLIMVIVGVGATIGMLVLGVPFALPLGLLAFFAEAIPMAGPWIAGIPIVLVALLESPLTALLIGIWFTALQQIESYILAPIVHGHVVKLSPFVVMVAILAGATIAGVVGAIIAIPLAAMVDLLIDDVILPLRRGSGRIQTEPV
jgi:predicted PurR-regulated permease PerM